MESFLEVLDRDPGSHSKTAVGKKTSVGEVLSIPQDYGAGNVIEITPAERKILHLNEPPNHLTG